MAEEEVHGGVEERVQPDEQRMSRLPSTVVRYMRRNRAKNTPCCSGRRGSPRRRNLDTMRWFSLLMLLFCLLRMKERGKMSEALTTLGSLIYTQRKRIFS